MKKEIPTTSAPSRSASSAAAAAVPPGGEHVVGDQNLLAPGHGVRVDLEAVAAVLEAVGDALRGARQLAGLADRNETEPSSRAMAAPNMKPRASIPRTLAAPLLRKGSAISRTAAPKACGEASSGVMSRNRIPGDGKVRHVADEGRKSIIP